VRRRGGWFGRATVVTRTRIELATPEDVDRDWPAEDVTRYLNDLVARGHSILYGSRGEIRKRVAEFYLRTLPRTYRASWPYVAASALRGRHRN